MLKCCTAKVHDEESPQTQEMEVDMLHDWQASADKVLKAQTQGKDVKVVKMRKGVAMTMLLHFSKPEGPRLWPLSHPSSRKGKARGHSHTIPMPIKGFGNTLPFLTGREWQGS